MQARRSRAVDQAGRAPILITTAGPCAASHAAASHNSTPGMPRRTSASLAEHVDAGHTARSVSACAGSIRRSLGSSVTRRAALAQRAGSAVGERAGRRDGAARGRRAAGVAGASASGAQSAGPGRGRGVAAGEIVRQGQAQAREVRRGIAVVTLFQAEVGVERAHVVRAGHARDAAGGDAGLREGVPPRGGVVGAHARENAHGRAPGARPGRGEGGVAADRAGVHAAAGGDHGVDAQAAGE
jgi:hypothetical protein